MQVSEGKTRPTTAARPAALSGPGSDLTGNLLDLGH
jgi:hypothetical protein